MDAGVWRKLEGMAVAVPATVEVVNMSKPPMRLLELRGGDMALLNIGSALCIRFGRLTVEDVEVDIATPLFNRGSRKSSKQSRPGRNPSMSGDPRGERSKVRSISSNEFVELGGEGGN